MTLRHTSRIFASKKLITVSVSLVVVLTVGEGLVLSRQSTQTARQLRATRTLNHLGDTPWEPTQRGGATRATSSTSPLCTSGQLKTQYWTTFPAMNSQMSGFNLVNISSQTCKLPVSPSSLYLANSDLSPAKVPLLDGPTGQKGKSDFVTYDSVEAVSSEEPSLPIPQNPAPISLVPGGTAVDILFGAAGINGPQGASECISTPVGGSIAVSLGSGQPIQVYMPAGTDVAKSQIDPTGAPFSSCTAVTFSPFLTWSEASNFVGAPYPRSTAGDLPLKNTTVYVNAP